MSNASHQDCVLVLAGNPNCGKTALFNALTGSRQKVGNWPGVTVDKKTGRYIFQNKSYCVVDLPGTYSTSIVSKEGSIDERIACRYLLSREADVVVNVIDGSNLERNLYLTLQLLEMHIPVILAVNMMDIVEKRGMRLDLKQLSKRLGCPAVSLVASRKKGIDELKSTIATIRKQSRVFDFELPLASSIQDAIFSLKKAMQRSNKNLANMQWLAQRLLEDDIFAAEKVLPDIVTMARQQCEQIEISEDEEPDILIADARYGMISDIVLAVTQLIKTKRKTMTQYIDHVVLNRYLGIPIFLLMMYFMFVFSINVGGAFQDFFNITSMTIFVNGVAHVLIQWHTPIWITAIIANGIGKGINTVVTFIPIIGAMFLFLSFLEDSGYMARAAFVMDRFMQKLGLPGKSFVPMIVGFGCNVPAVMGARTLANRRDRILTIMMMPFMSCGARLAIFAVFASAFFPVGGEDIIFLLYITGILAAVLTGLLLRKTVLPGKSAPLVMELPPYHLPRFGALCRHMWQRLKRFILRAGRVILPVCVIIGVLSSVTMTGQLAQREGSSQQSLLSEVGRVVTPVLAPMGIEQNNWPATVGLVTGVLAKEVVVGTLNTLYSQQAHLIRQEAKRFNLWHGLRAALISVPNNLSGIGSALKNPLLANEAPHDINHAVYGVMYHRFDGKIGAFSYLLFILLYFPCVSTMAATRRELNRRWATFSVFWSTTFAYAVAVIVYQVLTLMRHPISSLIWLFVMMGYLMATILMLRHYAHGKYHSTVASEMMT